MMLNKVTGIGVTVAVGSFGILSSLRLTSIPISFTLSLSLANVIRNGSVVLRSEVYRPPTYSEVQVLQAKVAGSSRLAGPFWPNQ